MSLAGKGNKASLDAAINSPKKSGPSVKGIGARSEKSLNEAKGSAKGGKSLKGVGARSEASMNAAKSANKSSSIKQGAGKVAASRSDKVTGKMAKNKK